MLDAFIIEELRRREEEERAKIDRPTLILPLDDDSGRASDRDETLPGKGEERGVVVIEMH